MLNLKRLGLLFVVALIAWRIVNAAPAPAEVRTNVNPSDGLVYVWIPPGVFQMGCSPDDSECSEQEKPAHSVTITKGFWIGKTPVTQAAYQKVVGSNPSHFHGDQLPVEQVSWEDAQRYCEAVKMRLPTEAEWEYAARGGSPNARYAPLDSIGWYNRNSGRSSRDVAQKQSSDYGLYDMLGNVWEWVADWYGTYDAASSIDPKGPPSSAEGRVLRGGSWVEEESSVRVSNRDRNLPDSHDLLNGFRCAGN
jgi:formylglycine-generating enzyme required for sulfatase activity